MSRFSDPEYKDKIKDQIENYIDNYLDKNDVKENFSKLLNIKAKSDLS